MTPHAIKYLPFALCIPLLIISCAAPGPEPIRYGEDVCDYCRMTVVEQNFGSELVTRKGKVYKFDSIECLAAFAADERVAADEIHSLWITDFSSGSNMVSTVDAYCVHTDHARSPMGMGLFGFSSQSAASAFSEEHQGRLVSWSDLVQIVADAWKLESGLSKET